MTSHLLARQREAFLARFLRLGKEKGQLYEYIAARYRRLVAVESMQEYLPAIPEVGVVAVEWWPEPPRRHVRATQRDAAAPAAAPQPRHAHAPRPTAKQQSASWTFEQRAAWALEQAALVANCKAKTARMLATQRQRIAERAATAAAAAKAAAAQGAAAAVQSATAATAATAAATATAAAAAVQGGSATAAATAAAAAAMPGAPGAAATCPSVPASSAWLWNPVPWPQLQWPWPGTAGDRCAPLLEIVTHSTPDHAPQAAAALPPTPPSHIWAPAPARAAATGLLSQLCGTAAAAAPSLARGTTYALQTILTTTTATAAPELQHPCSPITTADETSMYGMLQELSVVVASDAAPKLHPAACAAAAAPQPQQPWWLWAASLTEAGLSGGATCLGSGASAKEAGYLADAPDVWCAVQVHVHAAGGDTPKDKSSRKAAAAGRTVTEKENLRRYALLNSYMKRSGQNVTDEPCV